MSGHLPQAVLREAAVHVEPPYPREGGGLILRAAQGWRVVPVPNVSARPERCFELEPEILLRELSRTDQTLAVLFHSHCDGEPGLSAADRHAAAPTGQPLYPGVSQLVISVCEGRAVRFALHRWTAAGWEELQAGPIPRH